MQKFKTGYTWYLRPSLSRCETVNDVITGRVSIHVGGYLLALIDVNLCNY